MINDDRIQERSRKSMHRSITQHQKKPSTQLELVDRKSELKKSKSVL